jgi:hypothetical protein
MHNTMKTATISASLCLFIAGCARPYDKWLKIARGPNLCPMIVMQKLGKPTIISKKKLTVFRNDPGGWFNGEVTTYRYVFKEKDGENRYMEFYFSGNTYLSDGTTLSRE